MITRFLTALFFLAIAPVIAHANDSVATKIGGGLVLLKQQDIAMVSEDLYLSAKKIEVNYVFANQTDHDITTTVAFPFPQLPIEPVGDMNDNYDREKMSGADNFINFRVWVEGQEVNTSYDKKVAIGDENGDFEGEDVYKLTYYWQQTFPAGKKIHVRHVYKPLKGGSAVYPPLGYLYYFMTDEKHCPDSAFKNALYNRQEKLKYNFAVGTEFGYILKTGANWAGGTIGDFRLVVDKGSPDALVSFCGKNVKKISPTQFEMRAKNFRPEKNIYVFIIDGWRRLDKNNIPY